MNLIKYKVYSETFIQLLLSQSVVSGVIKQACRTFIRHI